MNEIMVLNNKDKDFLIAMNKDGMTRSVIFSILVAKCFTDNVMNDLKRNREESMRSDEYYQSIIRPILYKYVTSLNNIASIDTRLVMDYCVCFYEYYTDLGTYSENTLSMKLGDYEKSEAKTREDTTVLSPVVCFFGIHKYFSISTLNTIDEETKRLPELFLGINSLTKAVIKLDNQTEE